MGSSVWLINNSNVIEMDGLMDSSTGQLIDGGYTINATLSIAGAPVPGQVWPLELAYQSPGVYRGRGETGVTLAEGDVCQLHVVAYDAVNDIRGEWNQRVIARVRGGY